MIGLGVSAISDSWYGFAQNAKNVDDYQKSVGEGIIPVVKGHLLTNEDLVIRKHILNLMCLLKTEWNAKSSFLELPEVLENLVEMEKDGLLAIHPNSLQITEKGRPFVRNACMAFDLRLQRKRPETQLFSMTV